MFGTGDARHVGARVEHRLCEANAAANFAEAELDSMRAAFLFFYSMKFIRRPREVLPAR